MKAKFTVQPVPSSRFETTTRGCSLQRQMLPL
jgi:hypothetical protein